MPPRMMPGITVQRDIEYVERGGKSRTLDLFLPEKTDSVLPVIVWIHGGGWKSGSKEMTPRIPFVRFGYAFASLNYRLSGEAPWPAQLDDCKAAIRWLRANAAKFHLDPDRIGVWGQSSGGHLVAMLGVTGDKDNRVQAVCDWSGSHDLVALFDLKVRNQDGTTGSPIIELLGGPGVATKPKAAQASPLTHVSKDAPPFLIMHGDKDPLIPIKQSELLDAALRKAGVECKFVVVPGAGHGFGGPDINNQVVEFFDKHLKSSTAPAAAPSARATTTRHPASTGIQWIDVHNHFYPDNFVHADFSDSVRVALAQMDQAGISKKILLPPPVGVRPDVRFLQACQQACRSHRDRFAFGCCADLNAMITNSTNVTDALRHEAGREIRFGVLRPGATIRAERHARHAFDASGHDHVLPAASDLLRGEVHRLQTRGAEAVDLHARDPEIPARLQRRRLRDHRALLAHRRDDAHHDVVELRRVEGQALLKLREQAGQQIDRLHLVEAAVLLAFAARRAHSVEDHRVGHGDSPIDKPLWCSSHSDQVTKQVLG